MLERLISFFTNPFPIYDDRKSKWLIVLLPGIFTALFLNIFQPFTIRNPHMNIEFMLILSGYGLIGSMLLWMNEFWIWKYYRKGIGKGQWTIGKSLLWYAWHVFTLSFGIYAYWKYLCCGWMAILDMEGYPLMLLRTLAIGIFPLAALMTIQWVKWVKTRPSQISNSLDQPLETLITLTSDYRNEQLQLPSSHIFYIESADNYVAIYFKDEQGISRKLLRSSLSRMEKELNKFSNFMRCHRSFLVNLHQIEFLHGNSKKPLIHLRGVEHPIPVARKKVSELKSVLQENA